MLSEFLLAASAITIALAALRAGVPTPPELTALVALVLVVTVQVVAAGMRWSARRPFPVDLRSARATPAPPLVMVGYSTRLALTTTFTGLVFSMLARVPDWRISILVASPSWPGPRPPDAHRPRLGRPGRAGPRRDGGRGLAGLPAGAEHPLDRVR